MTATTVTVIGGGVAGLVAARDLALAGLDVLLREGAGELGGKLRTSPLAGRPLDEGAEAFLVRVPEGLQLAAELGLPVVHPTTSAASVLVSRRLIPLPTGTQLGVPGSLRGLRRVLGPVGVVRAAADLVLPASTFRGEPTVGELVRARVGGRVLDRLVEPLLGGVYAGNADELGVRAVVPALANPGRSLIATARAARPAPSRAAARPVFGTIPGGMARLSTALAATPGLRIRTGSPVRALAREGAHWLVDGVATDAVVLAAPAPAAARLLTDIIQNDAAPNTRYSSVAILGLALSSPPPVGGSGFLIPPSERRMLKAVTLHSQKWGDLSPPTLVRASVGRMGSEAELQRSDIELIGVATAELSEITGWRGRVLDARVTRWGGALPQYLPGHGDRVSRLRAALPAGLVVAGAGYDGVGIPACIRSGHRAAAELLALVGD